MKALFDQSTDEALSYRDFPRAIENVKRDSSGQQDPYKEDSFVQLEIQVEALRRLIAQHRLVIEEIHCLNGRSKNIVRQTLLDSLVSSASCIPSAPSGHIDLIA
ncbi:MAG: hypothetical protein QGG67_00630 [Gammaproteobacteria bacterium]|jgi:hypothetical protein|nr:hypothetical protein [Gammaproteobacteria bacterium]MDP6094493.1 hypothetical protein [Gammaproteobacteria bacterium]|tara:strand:- start:3 stop:314 length:312 start_codon:yes stop_codon:yes gene_type:complete